MADVLAEALVELEPDIKNFAKKLIGDTRRLSRSVSALVANTESKFKDMGDTGTGEFKRVVDGSELARRQMLVGWRETAQGFEKVYKDAATGIERSVDVSFKSIIRQQEAQARSAEDELKKLSALAERESRTILQREERQAREISRIVERFDRQRERESAKLAATQERQARAAAREVEKINKAAERQAAQLSEHYERESQRSGSAIERNIGGAIQRVARTAGKSALDFSINTAGLTSAVGQATKLGAVLSTLGVGALAGQAGIAGIAAVISGLSETIGVITLLPAIGGAAAASLGVLALGIRGVGDALSETDPVKFAEALEKLAPSARDFARSVRDAQPAVDALQRAVQQELFVGFAGEVDRLSDILIPRFQRRLVGLASEFNDIGLQVSHFLTSARTIADVDRIIERTAKSTDIFTAAVKPALRGLRDIGAVGAEFLPQLAGEFATVSIRFGEFISRARESGALQSFIQRGISSTKQLGRSVGNLGRVVGGVLDASEKAGGGFLQMLENVTRQLAVAVNSVEGQETLATFFGAARDVAKDLLPLVGSIAGIIGRDIAPLLARVGGNVLPAITRTVDNLGRALGTAAPGIADFSKGFADLLDGLTNAGVIDTLGDLVNILGDKLGDALRDIAPVLGEVLVKLGSELSDILPKLIPRLADFARSFGELLQPALDFLGIIGDIASEVVLPALAKIADTLAPVIDKFVSKVETVLLPALPKIKEAFDDAIEAVGPLVDAIGDDLVEALELLVETAPDAIGTLKDLAEGAQPLVEVIGPVVSAIGDLNGAFDDLLGNIPTIREAVAPNGLFGILTAGLNPITIITGLNRSVKGLSKLLVDEIRGTTREGEKHLFDFVYGTKITFTDLRDRTVELLSGMRDQVAEKGPLITDIFLTGLGRMKDGSFSIFGAMLADVTNLFDRTEQEVINSTFGITDAVDRAWNKVAENTARVWGAVDEQISRGIIDAATETSKLPGSVQSSLGHIETILQDSGARLIVGFIVGMKSRELEARRAAAAIMENVSRLFPKSPAQEGPFSGRGWTPFRGSALIAGFTTGMLDALPALHDAATLVARTVSDQLAVTDNPTSGAFAALQGGVTTAQRITRLTTGDPVSNRTRFDVGADASTQGSSVELPALTVKVQIGERELTPMITEVIDESNGRIKRAVTSRARRTL